MTGFFETEIARALGKPTSGIEPKLTGAPFLASVFDVSGLVQSSVSAAATELAALTGGQSVEVARDLAEHWFGTTLRPIGWQLPSAWDAVAGIYQTSDSWIRLHTNVPAHRDAALTVLDAPAERTKVAAAVARWAAEPLQEAVIAAGGVAAALLDMDQWAAHPQGRAVAAEPLIAWEEHSGHDTVPRTFGPGLTGLRVLDLTRVLAGPVATRFLAGFGAQVLRIDPPGWEDRGLPPETALGKACAGLDLNVPDDRARFEALLSQAHVLVHGYRPGALAGLGYDETARRRINPGMVEACLSAYGWSGPWAGRRGFDSIVQMNSGIAHAGMTRTGADRPVPLPVQALDHATGYLIAAAVLRALRSQSARGTGLSARLSLARTAALLVGGGFTDRSGDKNSTGPEPALEETVEETAWGPARRAAFPVQIDGSGPDWRRPAAPLRSAPPEWPN